MTTIDLGVIPLPHERGPAARNLPERRAHGEVVAGDDGPQAHRHPLPGDDDLHALARGRLRPGAADRAPDAGPDDHGRLHVQPHVHDARHRHGLAVHDPVHPDGVRQLPPSDHDRREGRRLSPPEPRQLLHLPGRSHLGHRRACGWAAATRAGPSTRRTAPTRRAPSCRRVFGIFILGWSTIITGVNFIVTTHTMRAKGITWFRMPLFVWAIYGVSIIQTLATPVLALSLLIVGIDQLVRLGALRPRARRRPGALSAPLLVLLAPRRLHHDPAGHGGHQRDRPDLQPQEPGVVQGHRVLDARHRVRRIRHVGSPHVRRGHQPVRRRRVRRALDARRHLQRHQGVHLGADDAQRRRGGADAAHLLLRVPLPLRVRRDDGRRRRDAEPRRALARHLLRRRPLPLHHGRRNAHGVARRAALLVPEDHRPHVPRAVGDRRRDARLRRLLHDVLSPVSARQRGNAQALLLLPIRSTRRCT